MMARKSDWSLSGRVAAAANLMDFSVSRTLAASKSGWERSFKTGPARSFCTIVPNRARRTTIAQASADSRRAVVRIAPCFGQCWRQTASSAVRLPFTARRLSNLGSFLFAMVDVGCFLLSTSLDSGFKFIRCRYFGRAWVGDLRFGRWSCLQTHARKKRNACM